MIMALVFTGHTFSCSTIFHIHDNLTFDLKQKNNYSDLVDLSIFKSKTTITIPCMFLISYKPPTPWFLCVTTFIVLLFTSTTLTLGLKINNRNDKPIGKGPRNLFPHSSISRICCQHSLAQHRDIVLCDYLAHILWRYFW